MNIHNNIVMKSECCINCIYIDNLLLILMLTAGYHDKKIKHKI